MGPPLPPLPAPRSAVEPAVAPSSSSQPRGDALGDVMHPVGTSSTTTTAEGVNRSASAKMTTDLRPTEPSTRIESGPPAPPPPPSAAPTSEGDAAVAPCLSAQVEAPPGTGASTATETSRNQAPDEAMDPPQPSNATTGAEGATRPSWAEVTVAPAPGPSPQAQALPEAGTAATISRTQAPPTSQSPRRPSSSNKRGPDEPAARGKVPDGGSPRPTDAPASTRPELPRGPDGRISGGSASSPRRSAGARALCPPRPHSPPATEAATGAASGGARGGAADRGDAWVEVGRDGKPVPKRRHGLEQDRSPKNSPGRAGCPAVNLPGSSSTTSMDRPPPSRQATDSEIRKAKYHPARWFRNPFGEPAEKKISVSDTNGQPRPALFKRTASGDIPTPPPSPPTDSGPGSSGVPPPPPSQPLASPQRPPSQRLPRPPQPPPSPQPQPDSDMDDEDDDPPTPPLYP
jgi:Wiskott-Aldrich syndrome protein